MIVFLHLDPQTGNMNLTVDGPPGDPKTALQMLAAAQQILTQQLAGPKLFLPNGQAKTVTPPSPEPLTPERLTFDPAKADPDGWGG